MLSSELATYVGRVVELYKTGLSKKAIAKEVKLSPTSVSRILTSCGMSLGRNYSFVHNLTDYQQDVLIGTLLGDGCLSLPQRYVHAHLSFNHGKKQRDYCAWKASVFGSLFRMHEPRRTIGNGNEAWQISSRCHPLLTDYYRLFYNRPDDECNEHVHKKRITREILNRVNSRALAIWFCDDGTSSANGLSLVRSFKILLGGMVEEDYELVYRWFRQSGWNVTKNNWNDRDKSGNRVALRFSTKDSDRLVGTIKPYIPPSMQWKLHEGMYGCYGGSR